MNQNEFKQGLAVLFSVHPQLEPKHSHSKDLVYRAWFKMFADLEGNQFLNAVTKFVLETPKLYPGDNFVAMIRQAAVPVLQETEGDVIELAFQAVRDFGYMRERDAMQWLKTKSPLVAAAVQRIGFLALCKCEEPDVIRGQLRAIFKGEKDRARQSGGIVESATHLEHGLPDNKKLIGLLNKIGNHSPPGDSGHSR